MNDQFSNQAQEMFSVAKDARIPENVQAIAEQSVTKTREAYEKMSTAATDQAKVAEEIMLATQAGAKSLTEKMLQNTAVNTEATFDAAEAMARAKTLPEAARVQQEFMQRQMSVASAQTKELFELYTKVTQQAFQTMNEAATKSFEQVKKG